MRRRIGVRGVGYALISPEAIGCVQIFHSADAFLVERTGIRSRVEIEITWVDSAFGGRVQEQQGDFTSKYLVTSLAA